MSIHGEFDRYLNAVIDHLDRIEAESPANACEALEELRDAFASTEDLSVRAGRVLKALETIDVRDIDTRDIPEGGAPARVPFPAEFREDHDDLVAIGRIILGR